MKYNCVVCRSAAINTTKIVYKPVNKEKKENEGKKEKKLSHSDQNKLPTNEKDIDSNGSAVSLIFTVKSVDQLSNLEKSEEQITDLIKSEKKSTSNSAAKLIDKIEVGFIW